MAQTSVAEALGYSFAGLQYNRLKLDDVPVEDPDGFGLTGSFELGNHWFVSGSYGDVGNASLDAKGLGLGGGHYWNTSDKTNVFVTVSYAKVELTVEEDASVDENAYAVATGIRSNVSEKLELNAGLSYTDTGDADAIALRAGALLNFNDTIGLTSGLSVDNDSNIGLSIGARVSF